jgi:hypothetical protein
LVSFGSCVKLAPSPDDLQGKMILEYDDGLYFFAEEFAQGQAEYR